jgi:hypothetical protein
MQTYHYPTTTIENTLAGAVGILFAVDTIDGVKVEDSKVNVELTDAEIEIIDTFFQSLQWD